MSSFSIQEVSILYYSQGIRGVRADLPAAAIEYGPVIAQSSSSVTKEG